MDGQWSSCLGFVCLNGSKKNLHKFKIHDNPMLDLALETDTLIVPLVPLVHETRFNGVT
jgi:hypothetical protein